MFGPGVRTMPSSMAAKARKNCAMCTGYVSEIACPNLVHLRAHRCAAAFGVAAPSYCKHPRRSGSSVIRTLDLALDEGDFAGGPVHHVVGDALRAANSAWRLCRAMTSETSLPADEFSGRLSSAWRDEIGKPWLCQPVAAPGAKSQRVMRMDSSSCCTVGVAEMSQIKAMASSPGAKGCRSPAVLLRHSNVLPPTSSRLSRFGYAKVGR